MPNRLTDIVTRSGDQGSTGLGDGSRRSKAHIRIHAIGEVDELNANLGVLLTQITQPNIEYLINQIQHSLFDLGSELAVPGYQALTQESVARLDHALDDLRQQLPDLKEFILPGGCMAAAFAHVARTVCRRAERRVVELAEIEVVSDYALQFLNRLSDYLFQLARVLNQLDGHPDIYWHKEPNTSPM